jgi:hypothetical protein
MWLEHAEALVIPPAEMHDILVSPYVIKPNASEKPPKHPGPHQRVVVVFRDEGVKGGTTSNHLFAALFRVNYPLLWKIDKRIAGVFGRRGALWANDLRINEAKNCRRTSIVDQLKLDLRNSWYPPGVDTVREGVRCRHYLNEVMGQDWMQPGPFQNGYCLFSRAGLSRSGGSGRFRLFQLAVHNAGHVPINPTLKTENEEGQETHRERQHLEWQVIWIGIAAMIVACAIPIVAYEYFCRFRPYGGFKSNGSIFPIRSLRSKHDKE